MLWTNQVTKASKLKKKVKIKIKTEKITSKMTMAS
jgi:hypothetical protein